MYSFFLYMIQVSEVGCSICCTSFRYAQVLLRPGTWASRPRQKKKWMSMCTHQCCLPHGIAGVTPTSLATKRDIRPYETRLSASTKTKTRPFRPTKIICVFCVSARHYHYQRDVVASRDVGVSPAIMLNPERGDYETLVVSRSVLSGSTKLMLNA